MGYLRDVVYLKRSSVLLWIFKKIEIEILHGIYKRDIGYSSFDFQGYRILMTSRPRPPLHTHKPPSHPIQASPFAMHANEYAPSLLSLGIGPFSGYQRVGVMQAAENFA